MYPLSKFGIPTSKNVGDMDRTRKRDGRTDRLTDGQTDGQTVRLLYASQSSFGSKNWVRGQGQGHSDPKMVRDTLPSQDVSTSQIWNSYLKECRRYGPDTKAGRTDGRTDSAITICLPKFLWGHKNTSNYAVLS